MEVLTDEGIRAVLDGVRTALIKKDKTEPEIPPPSQDSAASETTNAEENNEEDLDEEEPP